jgi:carboxyl-terminal processing protease
VISHHSKFAPANVESVTSSQDRIWGAIDGMVNSLGDPYTKFLDPQENSDFQTSIQGEFSGVGMEIGVKDDILTVIAPLKNTPAELAGIESGDKIIAIDGVNSIEMSSDEAASRIRGETGTVVTLTLIRDGFDDPFDISITRDIINIPTLDWEIQDDVFVISLYNFSANSSSDFRNALREFILARKSKLIIDLRGNPGGFLDAAVDMASWFLPAGKVIVREDFGDGTDEVTRSKGYDIFNDKLKMAILVNGGSASASEILAGTLQEYGVATVIGSQTFGKGSVQQLIDVTDDTSLKVTIAQWLTPNGKSISDGGLTPDIVIDEGDNVWDLQFQKALEMLQ